MRLATYTLISILVITGISCTRQSQTKLEFGLDLHDTLRINAGTEPPTLDWNKSTDNTSSLIQINIMEGLSQFNFDTNPISAQPALAESWESSDQKTWTFKIRKNVKWSDGKPLIAQHFVDGWERLLRPSTAAEYAYYLFDIHQARSYNEGQIKDFSKVGVKAIDDHTLHVQLEESQSYFPLKLNHTASYPIRKDVIKKYGEDTWADAGQIVGLGAYNLKRWEHDRILHLERNEQYYGRKAKIKNILAYIIPEQSTAIGLIDTGKLDLQREVPKAMIRQFKQRDDFINAPFFNIYFYGFNTAKAPFDRPALRKAIAHSIDRGEIIKITSSVDQPTTNLIPPGLLGYDESIGLKFNPQKAKQILKTAQIDPKKLPPLTLHFNTNENHQLIAENVQAQLKRNLGLNVELKNEEWKVYLQTLKTNAFGIFRMGWIADYPDPHNFMNIMTSRSGNNRTHWKNTKYDDLIQKAALQSDSQTRRQIYRQAQKLVLEEDVAMIPLFVSSMTFLVSKRVRHFPINRMQELVFKDVELEQPAPKP